MNKEDGILMSKFLRGEVNPRKPSLTWKIRTWLVKFSRYCKRFLRKVIKIHKSTHLGTMLIMLLFSGCENNLLNSEESPVFELAGTSYWQLQHEGEGDDRHAVARVILQMYAYYDGVVEEVWFHGKIMDKDTYELISQDSVYIGHFVDRADSTFSIYRQDGYANRPEYPKWSMWVTL